MHCNIVLHRGQVCIYIHTYMSTIIVLYVIPYYICTIINYYKFDAI